MHENEIRQYLANVLHIAGSDGTLSNQENAAFQEICEQFKVKKKDITAAEGLAANPHFRVKTVGRYSDKIRMLEDMVYVAVSDGELVDAEKRIILNLAKEVGISQTSMNTILAQSRSLRDEKEVIFICGSCNRQISSSAKFCPECGAPIEEPARPVAGSREGFNYPGKGISIEFADSSAANFHLALAAARRAPDFQNCELNKKKWYMATWPQEQIAESLELAESLKTLRNRKVYLDGQPSQWAFVFGFVSCYQQRQAAYRPVEYCFGVEDKQLNTWGCKQANMPWTSWAPWFSYGRFLNQSKFVFDKKRIRHELETNLYNIRFCPQLRFDLVEKVFEMLPTEVSVSDGSTPWTYNQHFGEVPNSIKIVRKREGNAFTITDEFYSDGVRPVGISFAIDILKKALNACSMKDVNLGLLTE